MKITLPEIIKLINSKHTWDSKVLVAAIKKAENSKVSITFYHIGGYELLMDGTNSDEFDNLIDIQEYLDCWEIEYDTSLTDPFQLAESVESTWKEKFNDGGGSGWIEY